MLHVACGGVISEGEIRGSRSDLRTLAQALRTESSTLFCSTTDSAYPYERLLERINVTAVAGEDLRISVIESAGELEIRGDLARLAVVADNIENLASHGTEGDHWHLEHIPEEPYVAADSYPVTIVLKTA